MKKIRSIISSMFGSERDEASSAQECSNSSAGDCISIEQPDLGAELPVAVPSSSTGNDMEKRVAIHGGNFPGAVVGGTVTNNITQYHIHHHHHHSRDFDSDREITTYQGDFGRMLPPMEIPDVGEGYSRLDGGIFIYRMPMRPGVEIYAGKQVHSDVGDCNKKGTVREVTIKVVPASEMACTEINRLVELADHNNIVNIICSGKYPGPVDRRYIVTEQCSKDLQEYIEGLDGPCNFSVASVYAKQLASGLAFIHKNNFIHGDLKPVNILLSRNHYYVKISDFGYSQKAEECKLTICKPGTDGFKAPELYGENPSKDFESDIFSYGLVIFFLFTGGRHPFGAASEGWSYNIKRKVPADLQEIETIAAHNNCLELVPLIEKTLVLEPSHRPKSEEIIGSRFFREIDCESLQRPKRPRQTINRRSPNYIHITNSRIGIISAEAGVVNTGTIIGSTFNISAGTVVLSGRTKNTDTETDNN